MPVIGSRPTVNVPPTTPGAPTQGAGATTGTSATTATQGTTAATDPTSQGGRVPSTSSQDLGPAAIVVNGFGGKPLPNVNITLVPRPGQLGMGEAKADMDDAGWVSRGYIDVKYAPAAGGVDVTVESHHAKPYGGNTGDDMVLYLQARVLDQGKERIITLSTLFDGVLNADGTGAAQPQATRRFHVDYDDINKFLKTKNPNLTFAPGDPLAVYAVWKKAGHQWGGFCREGYFKSPEPLGRGNIASVRTGGVVAAPTTVSSDNVDKPIDITHKVPDDVVARYGTILEKDAKFVSRREHEQKFCPKSLVDLEDATKRLLDVSLGDPKAREQFLLDLMGKDDELSKLRGAPTSGWSIKTTDRYYAKDSAGKILKDVHGLPVVAPMLDVYQDASKPSRGEKFPFARENMACRFRDGEIKDGSSGGSMGKLNMKTKRVVDPFTLTQTGLELSLDTKPGITKNPSAMQMMGDFLDKEQPPYSPLQELKKNNGYLSGANVTESAVINLANRYKFTLEHENGMELEVSMDFVHAGFMFESKTVPGTQAMSEAQKFDHYAALLAKPDASVTVRSGDAIKRKADDVNVVVIEKTDAQGKPDLTMAVFWTDAQGNKHATEHPVVKFPQVEIEMDHVQARSTGPVQQGYKNPTDVTQLNNDADQDNFLKGVSAQATMNGPPTTHAWEDLKNPKLYADPNYQQMQGAVVSFREGVFKNGVVNARQKAAQALELGGYVPKTPLTLSVSLPYVSGRGVKVETSYQDRSKINIAKDTWNGSSSGTIGKPTTLSIDWNDFPIRIPLTGKETPKDVAELVQQTLDKAVLYKAVLTEANGTYSVQLVER